MQNDKEASPSLLSKVLPIMIGTLFDRLLLNPLDNVIIHVQQNKKTALEATRFIFREEGLPGFYKGMLWPFILGLPARLSVFGSYYWIKNYKPIQKEYDEKKISVFAALISGILFSLIGGPAEAKRTRKINNVKLPISDLNYRAMYRGFLPLLLRNCIGNTLMLSGSDYILSKIDPVDKENTLNSSNEQSLITPFFVGALTGGLSQVIVTPFDVIKTRMMSDSTFKPIQHHIKTIYHQHSFFASSTLRMCRIGLGSGVMIGSIKLTNNIMDKIVENNAQKVLH